MVGGLLSAPGEPAHPCHAPAPAHPRHARTRVSGRYARMRASTADRGTRGVAACPPSLYARPASMPDRNEVRGQRALPGRPAMTRLAEQHRMAVPWVWDTLAQ